MMGESEDEEVREGEIEIEIGDADEVVDGGDEVEQVVVELQEEDAWI